MKDYQTHLESLRAQAAESALISHLTTVPQKRELFARLAAHFDLLAAEVERAMATTSELTRVDSDTRPQQTSQPAQALL